MVHLIQGRKIYITILIVILFFFQGCSAKKKEIKKVEVKEVKIDSVIIKKESALKKALQKKRLKKSATPQFKEVLNQRLFFIEKETDSSYQIGSFQINSLKNPGSIFGWIDVNKDGLMIVTSSPEEYYKEFSEIKRWEGQKISALCYELYSSDDENNVTYKINKVKTSEDIFLIEKHYTDYVHGRTDSLYIINEKDTDSTYVFNKYKDDEIDMLIEEFGEEEYEEIVDNNEVDAYQHTPDNIYMKYLVKDHFKRGTFVEDGCDFIGELIFSFYNSNTVRTFKKGKFIFVYNHSQGYTERVKRIYKDKNEYVIMSDMIPKEETYGNHSNFILKDRIMRIRKTNIGWKAIESHGEEVVYKNLPTFYINTKNGLNVRSIPSVKGEKLVKLDYNKKVYVTDTLQVETIGKVTGNWLGIQFPGIKGYIFSPYVSKRPCAMSPD